MSRAVSRLAGILLGIGAILLALMAVQTLLEYAPDPHEASLAIESGDVSRLVLLLDRGLDPNAMTQSRNPLLLMTVRNGQPIMARLLLQSGANPNARDSFGVPALAVAVRGRNPEIVRVLLDFGATAASARGERPGHPDTRGILEGLGVSLAPPEF